jgi:hypothetical protein
VLIQRLSNDKGTVLDSAPGVNAARCYLVALQGLEPRTCGL